MTSVPQPSKHLFKFGLRTLLGLTFVAALLSATLGKRTLYVARQRDAVDTLIRFGSVQIQWAPHGGLLGYFATEPASAGQVSLAGGLLGEAFFSDVVAVALHYERQLSDDDLAHVAKLLHLRRLDLELTDIGDGGMQWLRGLTHLEYLELGSTRVTGAGLGQLQSLTALTSLGLDFTAIDDDAVATIVRNWPALRRLDLTSTGITNAALEQLVACQRLSMLNLTDTAITEEVAESLGQLRELRVLVLSNTAINDAALTVISRLPSLQELHLRGTQVTDKGMQHLAAAHNLKTLQISATDVTDTGLAHLCGLANLRNLDIRGLDVTNDGLASIARLPLEVLLVQDTQITTEGLLEMAELSAVDCDRYVKQTRLLESSDILGSQPDALRRPLDVALLKGVKEMPKLQLRPDEPLGESL